MGKDADFLYDTIETYIQDAQKANKSELVEIWKKIKKDRKDHMHLLKEALEKEIQSRRYKSAAVGACPQKGPARFTRFRIVVLFY